MKFRFLVGILAGGILCTGLVRAATYSFNFSSGFENGGLIPDGNVVGWSDTRTISGVEGTNVDVNVWINLSGGYNGDLYGYLTHASGFAILLNRVGRTNGLPFGYSDSGMNILFDDGAANGDIHYYQLVPNYTINLYNGSSWAPDGRNISPASLSGNEARTALLSSFIGLGANGPWTLFLADLSVGEETLVNSWGLEITAIPEPSTWTVFSLGLLACAGMMCFRRRRG